VTRPASGRPWILVVDDDSALRESAADALSDAGHEVRVAGDGGEALRLLYPRPPGLVLLDLMMPSMDGWRFRAVQRSDQRIRAIPVVVMTAARDLDSRPIEAASILLKPFRLDDLLAQVLRLVPPRPAVTKGRPVATPRRPPSVARR
jgi:CheY-like chemotaxis protein